MTLRGRLKQRALEAGQQALEQLLADDDRAERLARAVGQLQQTGRAAAAARQAFLSAFRVATRRDLREVNGRLAALRKRARALHVALAQASGPAP